MSPPKIVLDSNIFVGAGFSPNQLFNFPTNPPMKTWIAVPALANEEFLVEIEPVALIDELPASAGDHER